MTTPPPDDHDDPTPSPDEPVDDERLAALRALLRDEPIDVDPEATESRIMAALDAAGSAPMPTTAPPAPRHRSARPVLVAAAVLAVLGVGAVVWSSATRDADFMASSEDAGTADMTARAPEDDAAAGGAAGEALDGSAEAGSDRTGPASTLAPAPGSAAADAALPDLGRFDSVEDLMAGVAGDPLGEVPADAPTAAGRSEQFDLDLASAPACATLRRSAGEQVLGVATVAGTTVLLVEVDGTRALFEVPGCRRLG